MIEVKDRKVIMKHRFTDEHYFTARCLGMGVFESEQTVIADLVVTRNQALFEFLQYALKDFATSPLQKSKRDAVYAQIKQAYLDIKNEFLSKYESKFPLYENKHPLRKYQIQDLMHLVNNKHNLLSWEQGLGKTIEGATVSKLLNISRTIIVAPAMVKWGWYKSLTEDWGFDATKFTILDASKRRCLNAFFQERFVIVNYEMVDAFFDQLTGKPVGHIILDESTKIKNKSTGMYKAVARLVKHFPDAKITLMSGTPIANRVNDLFAPLRLCKHPLGDNEKYFKHQYLALGARGKVIGARNHEELKTNISNFVLRRISEGNVDLPAMNVIKSYFQLDEYQAEYDKVLEDIENKMQDRFEFLEANKNVINEYEALKYRVRELDEAGDAAATKVARSASNLFYQSNIDVLERYNQEGNLKSTSSLHSLNIITAMSKIKGIVELAEEMMEADNKVAIFGSYHAPLEQLRDIFGDKAVLITGKVSSHERNLLKEKFVNDPECKVYLANMEAGGIGIDGLQKVCNNVIFLNFPFVPKDIEQAYKRIHRSGQKKMVNIYYTICEESIDEILYDMVADKASDTHKILDDGSTKVMDYHSVESKLFSQLLKKRDAGAAKTSA